MPFPDDLRPASFRGVPFRVSAARTGGLARRGQVIEYPERDIPFAEDLGRQAGSYELEAFVAGDDYMAARDALVAACAEPGTGQLVHPTFGERTVLCLGCEVQETVATGAMASIALSFAEAGDNRFPSSTPFTKSLVGSAADTASSSTHDSFVRSFSVVGVPQWVAESARTVLLSAQTAMAAAVRAVPKAENPDLGQVTRDLATIVSAAGTLMGDPAGLATKFANVIQTVGEVSAGALDTIRILEGLSTFGDQLEAGSTLTEARARAQSNQAALVGLVRRNAIAEAARAVPDAPVDSYGDAVALRDRMSTLLDDEIHVAADALEDEDAAALRALHLETVRDLTLRAGQLRTVQAFTPIDTIPAVVIAQRLYGDALRADEIVARNHVEHPGYVPGGVELEVLSA